MAEMSFAIVQMSTRNNLNITIVIIIKLCDRLAAYFRTKALFRSQWNVSHCLWGQRKQNRYIRNYDKNSVQRNEISLSSEW